MLQGGLPVYKYPYQECNNVSRVQIPLPGVQQCCREGFQCTNTPTRSVTMFLEYKYPYQECNNVSSVRIPLPGVQQCINTSTLMEIGE